MVYASDVETGDSDNDEWSDIVSDSDDDERSDSDSDSDDNRRLHHGRSRDAECRAYTLLSSVCWSWHLTLSGWPLCPTGHWVRHQLRKLIKCE